VAHLLVTPDHKPTKPPQPRGHLLRVLGLGFGLAVIIGNTIGAGIFRSPGVIAEHLPNVWLFLAIWIVAGLYALLGAINMAELGAMLPKSGGQYVFARYALGEYAGFMVGWTDWLTTCGSTAAIAIVIGSFTGALFSTLGNARGVLAIASGVTIFFALLQWRGIVLGSTAQNVTSLMKALAFLALIIAAFTYGNGGAFAQPKPQVSLAGAGLLTAIVLSLQAALYTYDGWYGIVYFSEEVTNPGKDIPRSMIGGVVSVIVIYVLVNVALLYVLPMSQLVGKEFAAGEAANVLFGRYGDPVFRWLTILSMLSAVNACHLMNTRVLFAMARDGLFLKRAADVNEGGTPALALFIHVLGALLFIIFGQTFEQVITVVAFFFVANYSLSFISVFVLRRREPEKKRPYRAWGYPWTTALVLGGSIVFLAGAIASDTRNSVYALLILAVSYPVFRVIRLATDEHG
jgi:APA family basic amino acid/polyamine antiporter